MLDKTKTDKELGLRVRQMLKEKGIETPITEDYATSFDEFVPHFTQLLKMLGLDLQDDSLQDTPKRLAKMWVNELFWGLNPSNFPKLTVVENKMKYREMVLERRIRVSSTCEHHLSQIDGYAHVAYIPDKKVAGLSKLNRVVEYFSRRPQVQERLTEQIFHTLQYLLETDDVAIMMVAKHSCVKMRGIEDPNTDTITSRLGGAFYDDPSCRSEFMSLVKE